MHDLYRPFRNYLRQFPRTRSLELLWGYSEHIANGRPLPPTMQFRDSLGHPFTKPFQVYAWEIDLLAREIILNGDVAGRRSFDSWQELSKVINRLRNLENEVGARYGSPDTILRDLHRVVHHQFPWQRPPSTRSMMRAYKLFGTDAMRAILEETTGVPLDAFFRLGMACAGHFLRQPGLNTQQDYGIIDVSHETATTFFARLTSDMDTLRAATCAAQRYDDSWSYAHNPLRALPLIRFDKMHPERVLCPIPTFLMRRFSEGLFYDVAGHPRFAKAFGAAFEAYVGSVLSEVLGDQFAIRAEQEYRVGKNRKDGADWIVSDMSGHIFIECKTRRLRQDAKFVTEGGGLEAALDAMAGFIVQHYRNIDEALAGKTDWVPDGKPVFPLIVTLEDWWIFSPPIIKILTDCIHVRLAKAGLSVALLDEMPYAIASTDEFETAVQIMSRTGIAAYLGLKRTPEHRDWALSAFSPGLFQTELNETHRQLFTEEWRQIAMPARLA